MIRALAPAKINLALVVGPTRPDGLHEVATILQRVDLCDTITLEPSDLLEIEGFADDTIVRRALEAVARAAGVEPLWRACIEKEIPVAAGLGGGSSDAATAIRLANGLLGHPLDREALHRVARPLGADVPFFLEEGPQLGTGTGADLEPVELRQDFRVLLLLPRGEVKPSTGEIYRRFTDDGGFEERAARVRATCAAGRAADIAALPPNDLARSAHAAQLLALGAFRADVSGAGPTVYGLFDDPAQAERAASEIGHLGRVWLADPKWYV